MGLPDHPQGELGFVAMALAAPNPPWIRMTHPLIEGSEQYAMRDAWRTTWIYLGWETTIPRRHDD